MTVRLWIRRDLRPDGSPEPPKALALDQTQGPGPGRVVDVDARTANEARRLLALASTDEPSEELDPDSWTAWRAARRAVREVTPVAPTSATVSGGAP